MESIRFQIHDLGASSNNYHVPDVEILQVDNKSIL